MSRSLHCANVHDLGNAHSHITPESCTTPRTLPAQNSLKAAASAVLARTLPRTLPAQCEETPRTLPEQNSPECAGNVQRLSADFKLVSTWWEWSPDDIEHFRAWAKQNHDDAAQWIYQDAAVVREYRDRLHVTSVNEFIKPMGL
jgi:hypothetical protein